MLTVLNETLFKIQYTGFIFLRNLHNVLYM